MRRGRLAVVAAVGMLVVLGAGCGSADREVVNQNQKPAADSAGGGVQSEAGAPNKDQAATNNQQQEQPSALERKVVRSVQLSLEVDDIYAATRKAADISDRFGGYVADEKTDDSSGSIELKVASDDLDEAVRALSELGRVTSRGQQAKDVTEEFVDLESRIATQEASVARVRKLLDNATALDQVFELENQLTNRQASLESLKQRMKKLSGLAELSTVTVRVFKPGDAPAEEEETGFLAGLIGGWRVFVASTQVLLTVLGAVLPFLLAVSIPLVAVLWVRRRRPSVALNLPPAQPVPPGPTSGS